jgi:hypothetical protein
MIHDAHMIRQHQRFGLIVRDIHEGGAEGGLQLFELDFHVLAQLEIEGAQRLVEQQQCGFEHEATGDGHALALTARQLIDALGRGAGKPHALQHGVAASRAFGAIHAAAGQPEGHVLAHGHHGKQGQLLEYHVDGPTIRRDVLHAATADDDGAAIRRNEAGNHAQQGGLTAARGTEDGKEAAARYRERKRIDGSVIRETLGYGIRHQIRGSQLAAFTRSNTLPSISSRPVGIAGYQ